MINNSKGMAEYSHQSGLGSYNNSTDVFKWVFLSNTYQSIDANGSSVSVDDFTKVVSAGNYVQDTSLANVTWARAANITTLNFDDVTFANNTLNPVTGKTLAIYNSTSANNALFKVIDMTVDDGATAANTLLGFNWAVSASGSARTITNP